MPWNKMPKILTNEVYCPYCKRQGIKQRLACEIHEWAYRKWYIGLQGAFSMPLPDKVQTGFFAKTKDK
jgi:hypothetical protein